MKIITLGSGYLLQMPAMQGGSDSAHPCAGALQVLCPQGCHLYLLQCLLRSGLVQRYSTAGCPQSSDRPVILEVTTSRHIEQPQVFTNQATSTTLPVLKTFIPAFGKVSIGQPSEIPWFLKAFFCSPFLLLLVYIALACKSVRGLHSAYDKALIN